MISPEMPPGRISSEITEVGELILEICFSQISSNSALKRHRPAVVLEGFEHVLSQQNFQRIFEEILKRDGTAEKRFLRDGVLKWTVDLSQYPRVHNRYQFLLPLIFRSKRLGTALYPFQQVGKSWLLEDSTRILADDMGLGKTIQAIAAIEEGLFSSRFQTVLLICPKTVVSVWEKEFAKWCPMIAVSTIDASDISDMLALVNKISGSNVVIGTYPSLARLSDALKNLNVDFDLIVADEAHRLRKRWSQTSQAFKSLSRNCAWLLTGTPLERDEEDIRGILECLKPDSAAAVDSGAGFLIHKSRLRATSLRRTKADVLKELPDVERVVHWLDLGESQKQAYRDVLREMQTRPPRERIGCLSKLSLTAITDGAGNSIKIDRAVDLCQSAVENGKKIIIFSNFNGALKENRRQLNYANIKTGLLTGEIDKASRDRLISEFKQDQKFSCLLCNSKIGSEGLTLTEASVAIFLNEWWNPSSNRQAEDRINRIGQRENILIHILRSRSTIDENLGRILESKNLKEKDLLHALESQLMAEVV
jgi:SNF2 family DNA or RNA helicase